MCELYNHLYIMNKITFLFYQICLYFYNPINLTIGVFLFSYASNVRHSTSKSHVDSQYLCSMCNIIKLHSVMKNKLSNDFPVIKLIQSPPMSVNIIFIHTNNNTMHNIPNGHMSLRVLFNFLNCIDVYIKMAAVFINVVNTVIY